MKRLPNIHPGEVLLEEFLKPMGISQYRLAKTIGVPAMRISEICAGKRAVTAAWRDEGSTHLVETIARFLGA